jgi:methionyl-tRNA formyltransferase
MRVVFMGSAEVSAVVLRAMMEAPWCRVVGVATAPDRPAGRRLRTRPCPCRAEALRHGLETIAPEKINAPETRERIAAWEPEVIVVAAYGQLLGESLLTMPPLGCLNVHLSLLPRHRGAAPVQRAIATGDSVTGVTIMRMDKGMDSGDIVAQAQEPIRPDDTAGTLQERLAGLGADLLLRCLPEWAAGRIVPRPQNQAEATFAPRLRKEEGLLDWHLPATTLALRVRAFSPWPGCFAWLTTPRGAQPRHERLKVLAAAAEKSPADDLPPGTVADTAGPGPAVATGAGLLRLLRVQREGGRVVDGRAFLRGCPLRTGQPLGRAGRETP